MTASPPDAPPGAPPAGGAEGAPGRLTRLPFDHYARYRLAADVVAAVRDGAPGTGPATVLDVGGGPGSLAAFRPGDRVVASDVAAPGRWHAAAPSLVLADGAALPFPDGAFDVVVTLDTLEHVEPAARPAVLREAVRASRGWVLVVCPCATEGVAEADAALLALVRQRFGGDFPTVGVLEEHLAYGHPDPDGVAGVLADAGGQVARFPSGRLDRWLPMMVLFFHLLELGRDDPVERVQDWYNRLCYADDLRAPSYRQAFLCRLPGATGPPLDAVVDGLLPRGPSPAPDATALAALQSGLTSELARAGLDHRARIGALEAELAAEGAALDAARRDAGKLRARAEGAEQQAAALDAFRRRVLAHPLVRLRRGLRRARPVRPVDRSG